MKNTETVKKAKRAAKKFENVFSMEALNSDSEITYIELEEYLPNGRRRHKLLAKLGESYHGSKRTATVVSMMEQPMDPGRNTLTCSQ